MSEFKKRLMLTIGIPLGVALVLAILLLLLSSDTTKRTSQIQKTREELVFRSRLTESLAVLRQSSEEAEKYKAELENILPSRDQLVNFPRDLGTIARQNEVDLNSSLGEEKPGDSEKLRQTDLDIGAQGTLDNLIKFLKSLETGRYLVSLKSLDFTRQQDIFKTLISGQVFSF